MISAPSEMRCRSIPINSMIGKIIATVSGIDKATTAPGRNPRLTMLQAMMMAMACQRDSINSPMAFFTTTGWSDTRVSVDAERQIGHGGLDRFSYIVAQRQDVSAVAHSDRKADCWLTIYSEHRLRRIGQRPANLEQCLASGSSARSTKN